MASIALDILFIFLKNKYSFKKSFFRNLKFDRIYDFAVIMIYLRLGLRFYLMLIYTCLAISQNQNVSHSDIESGIQNEILSSYNSEIRPSLTVYVGVKFSLLKISSIDEANGVLYSSVYLFVEWYIRL